MTSVRRDFDLCAYSDPITDLVYGLEDQRLHGLKRGRSIWIDASQRLR